ncbi:MAG: YjgP/YjgQ family permease [Rikenellaceae bacterium]|nr:YjgP/YjgQ family permease [Rikenellaceae bacterium]
MKTIHKFTLKAFLGPMVLSFFIVMFILMMNFVWRYIDELVGKGLSFSVIIELLFYATANMMPLGIPLATLFAAIMTMGNLGEHNELLAMKSAGMSLLTIFRPLIAVVGIVAVASFFVVNDLVPYSNKKMMAIIYDIRQQKESMEFKDGIFFNGIDDMNIRVGHQDPKTQLLTDILIYDTRDKNGNMTTTVADSGYIYMSDDKKFLMVKLYNGQTYETTRNYKWNTENAIRHQIFKVQNGALEIEGFDFARTDMNLFNNHQTKNVSELQVDIDSLRVEADRGSARSYEPLLKNHLLVRDQSVWGLFDTVEVDYSYKSEADLMALLKNRDTRTKRDIIQKAKSTARQSRNSLNRNEDSAKSALNNLYRSQVEWHRKVSLPLSVIIFFLIGAPLGAIIRKGGLAMPVVVSVLFFVVYYIISIAGEKMAKEGTWDAAFGMWFSAIILLPIALYLTYIATNDSNLFNTDWYVVQFNKAKAKVQSLVGRKSNK